MRFEIGLNSKNATLMLGERLKTGVADKVRNTEKCKCVGTEKSKLRLRSVNFENFCFCPPNTCAIPNNCYVEQILNTEITKKDKPEIPTNVVLVNLYLALQRQIRCIQVAFEKQFCSPMVQKNVFGCENRRFENIGFAPNTQNMTFGSDRISVVTSTHEVPLDVNQTSMNEPARAFSRLRKSPSDSCNC